MAFDGKSEYFREGLFFYIACGYLYVSAIACLFVIVYTMITGGYLVRLHSIYMFTGILLGCCVSSLFVIILPFWEIYQLPLAALGFLVFLWFSWIPATQYDLFNIELEDFGQDFRNPRFSSIIISANRFLLNRMNAKAFKAICDRLEEKRVEEVFERQANLMIEAGYSAQDLIGHVNRCSRDITRLFFR